MQFENISVVIPVYNGERFLAEAIGSAVEQSHRPTEVVVVDDGSTDASAAVARRFTSVRYIYQENAGQAVARNRGVRESSGAFIAFLDADDIWCEKKLAWQIAEFQRNPSLDVVFGHAQQFTESLVPQDNADSRLKPRAAQRAHLPGAMLARRDAFDRVGGYATEWAVAEVIDWYARAVDCGLNIEVLEQVVMLRRIHGENITMRESNASSDYLSVVAATLQRRKAGGNHG